MKTEGKHGIELRFGKGRKLPLLSYAVYVNGACQVSHETTAANRKLGMDPSPVRLVSGRTRERLTQNKGKHYDSIPINAV